MKQIEVRTQEELDKALARKEEVLIACVGNGRFVVDIPAPKRGSSHVEARESSHVEAWGSSHVVARESSHVVARESSHVVARESSHVEASKWVSVHKHQGRGHRPTVNGGVILEVPKIATAQDWCDYYGVPIVRGTVVLFKAVDDDWRSSHGMSYAPGTTPEAPDWDGGKAECGGGLHFAFHPVAAKDFWDQATRFVGCPVRLDDIVVHPDADYPTKIKAPRVVAPGCFEVDRSGKPVTANAGVEP